LSGGDVYRLRADSERGDAFSFVLKREGAEAVERALCFHRAAGLRVAGSVPACLGGLVDKRSDTGVLLLEDVAPATQGDVLAGCSDHQALAAVRSLAQVHAATWGEAEVLPRWEVRALTSDEWAARLSAAADRFPDILTGLLANRLRELPRQVEAAIDSLEGAGACWIHADAHLDNVLFRADGRAVLLDWSGAVVGPPAVDLARFLTEGVNAGAREDLAHDLVSAYARSLADRVGSVLLEDVWGALSNGLAVLLQSAIGWAAREEKREPRRRMQALQENLLRSACNWAANAQMTKPSRLFALESGDTRPSRTAPASSP
jgi:aminoglycoside phosphotransferase (APT) family kinase protein